MPSDMPMYAALAQYDHDVDRLNSQRDKNVIRNVNIESERERVPNKKVTHNIIYYYYYDDDDCYYRYVDYRESFLVAHRSHTTAVWFMIFFP